jgi:hypothetical protein
VSGDKNEAVEFGLRVWGHTEEIPQQVETNNLPQGFFPLSGPLHPILGVLSNSFPHINTFLTFTLTREHGITDT